MSEALSVESAISAIDPLSGESLAQKLAREHVIDLPELAAILVPVVSALRIAHASSKVHADLNPASIFLSRGGGAPAVKLLHFDHATLAGAKRADVPAELRATPCYLAPEQVEGEKELDYRVDVWAIGMIAYQCLSGLVPTAGDSVAKVLENVRHRPFWPLREVVPELPEQLGMLVDRMLVRDRDARLADLREVEEALRSYAGAPDERRADAQPAPASSGPLWSEPTGERSAARAACGVSATSESEKPLDVHTGAPDAVTVDVLASRTPLGAASLDAGATFAGRYRVVQRIAAGGMGAVYEVIHMETARHRALKVLHPHVLSRPDARRRFQSEARVAAHVQSERLVDVLDAGIDEATQMPFLVMELLKGEDLGKRIGRLSRIPPADALAYLHETALAIAELHGAGVVHRDIKPGNIFVSSGTGTHERIRLLDFGIAKLVAGGESSAGATQSLGTPLYMAPEQFRAGAALSAATDIFGLAMVAYTLLVGMPYWHEESENDDLYVLIAAAMQGPSEPATARARRCGVSLPAAFDGWFARAAHKSPEMRPESAVAAVIELARALGVALEASTAASEVASAMAVVQPASRRRRYIGMAIVLGAALGAIAAIRSLLSAGTEPAHVPAVEGHVETSAGQLVDKPAGEHAALPANSAVAAPPAATPPAGNVALPAPARSDVRLPARPESPRPGASPASSTASHIPKPNAAPKPDSAGRPHAAPAASAGHPLYSRE